jgi:hypothetical protein
MWGGAHGQCGAWRVSSKSGTAHATSSGRSSLTARSRRSGASWRAGARHHLKLPLRTKHLREANARAQSSQLPGGGRICATGRRSPRTCGLGNSAKHSQSMAFSPAPLAPFSPPRWTPPAVASNAYAGHSSVASEGCSTPRAGPPQIGLALPRPRTCPLIANLECRAKALETVNCCDDLDCVDRDRSSVFS